MSEITLTDQNFEEEVMKSSVPVLVDFWAEWCGPCQMQGPILEEIAKDFSGQAKIGKLEVDQNPQTPPKFQIMSIPSLKIFKNGQVVWEATGLQQKNNLEAALKGVLGK